MKRAILRSEGTTLKRCSSSALPPFPLDRNSRRPLHLQIYDFLRRAIQSGDLPPGRRLPSTRAMAKSLGISRHTVLNAYEALSLEGWVAGKIGSGTRVSGVFRQPRAVDLRQILRESHFPAGALPFRDPDGNRLYLHR